MNVVNVPYLDTLQTTTIDDLKSKCEEIISKYGEYLDIYTFYIAIDSEWNSQYIQGFKNWLQSANILFYFKDGEWCYHIFLFTNNTLSSSALSQISNYFKDDNFTVVFDESIQINYIEKALVNLYSDSKLVPKDGKIIMKYSPLDLTALFSYETWVNEILKNKIIEQKRCLRFYLPNNKYSKRAYKAENSQIKYTIRDIQGLNDGSLKKQAESVGVTLLAKNSMDDYKLRMREGYEVKPLDASIYNITDALQTFETTLAYIPLVNRIITDVIGLPEFCKINEKQLKYTTGSLNGDLFEKYIEYFPYVLNKEVSNDDLDIWRIALRKHSIPKTNLEERGRKLVADIIEGMSKCSNLDEYKNYEIYYPEGNKGKGRAKKNRKEVDPKNYISLYEIILTGAFDKLIDYKIYQQASVKYLGRDTSNSLIFQAIVQGGRCNNSMPFEYYLETVLDIDLNSCYGSTLRTLCYPVGISTTINRDNSKPNKELFFKKVEKLESELLDDLWTADIFTNKELEHDNDLLYSTINVTAETINKNVGGSHYNDEGFEEEGDVKKIPSDFVLSRRDKQHTKITSQSLKLLNSVATDKERGEYKDKFSLDSMVCYLNQNKIDNPIMWAKLVIADKGKITQDGNNNKKDSRCRYFFSLPLENYIGKLVDERKKYKKLSKDKSLPEHERFAHNAYQEMLKLFINVTYGDLASVYFPFGNVVLANAITDRARCGAWMLSKALLTRGEITDGGFYSPKKVAFNKGEKVPGFNILSDVRRWKNSKGGYKRSIESLGGYNWDEKFLEYEKLLDVLKNSKNEKNKELQREFEEKIKEWNDFVDIVAKNHIDEFWNKYNLKLPFSIEHKYEHTAWKASYLNKSDYYFECLNGDEVFKKRGSKNLSNDLLEKGYINDPAFEYLKRIANKSTEDFKNCEYHVSHLIKVGEYQNAGDESSIKNLIPGVEIIQKREPRQYNNKHIYIKTVDEWQKINKRKGFNRGVRIQWFDRWIKEPSVMVEKMCNNELTVNTEVDNYESMTVKQLRTIAASKGIKGYKNMKKDDLILKLKEKD